MRRCRYLVRAAQLVSCATAVGALGCGGSGGSGGASTGAADASYLAAVTRAAAATDRVPGYKLALTTSARIGAKSVTVSGSGSVDARGREGSITLEGAGVKILELISTPYVYIQVPSGAKTSVTHGRPWIRANLSTFTQSYGESSPGGASPNPAQQLGYLRAAGTVTRVGPATIRGVPSTHYHAIIELARMKQAGTADQRHAAERAALLLEHITGAKEFPMDVWIGSDGRVSRTSYTLSLCAPQGRLQQSLSMDLFGYGRQPVVSPPPASQVTDIDARLKGAVAKALTQTTCH